MFRGRQTHLRAESLQILGTALTAVHRPPRSVVHSFGYSRLFQWTGYTIFFNLKILLWLKVYPLRNLPGGISPVSNHDLEFGLYVLRYENIE